ncbi:hypothetical protein BGW38_007801, partial [Lunasporangiospora selenospora]
MPISAETVAVDSTAPFKTVIANQEQEQDQIQDQEQTQEALDLQDQLEALDLVRQYTADSEGWIRRRAYSLVTDDY